MKRSIALIAAIAGASGAAAQSHFIASPALTGDFAVPMRTMLDQRYFTVIRQQFDFSCGSAALATLLRYHYGRRVREDDVFRGMWANGDQPQIRKLGFSLLDMKRYLGSLGLVADGYEVSLDDIAEAGLPGIALINLKNYKHFVVVKGVNKEEVLVGDPSAGLQPMGRDEFQAAWNGVYFVLNSEQDFGRKDFNGDAQWAAFSRAPVGRGFHDPISLQALALTAPFYRDF